MTLLAPVSRSLFARAQRGPLDPSTQTQSDDDAAAAFSLDDPAALFQILTGISALGHAHASRGASAGEAYGPTLVPSTAPRGSTDPARRRYVSGIAAETMARPALEDTPTAAVVAGFPFEPPARQGGNSFDMALPADLHGSVVGAGDAAHPPMMMPVQFSRVISNAARVPLGGPGAGPDENQNKTARGLMRLWRSLQESASSLSGGSRADASNDTSLPSLIRPIPWGGILRLITETGRNLESNFHHDSSENTPDDAEKNRLPEQTNKREEEADEDDEDLERLPRGPKLEPGFRPGNPGGNSARPKRLDQCLKAAESDEEGWAQFCKTVPNRKNVINKVVGGGSARAACESKTYESPQNRTGWCQNQYGSDSRKDQGPTLSSSAFNPLRNPPSSKRLRPFEADYPDLENDESGARLKYDVNGRPLMGGFTVGRTTVGGPDENLSPRAVDSWISYLKQTYPDRWRDVWLRRGDLRIDKIDKTAPRQKDLINARWLAYMIDDLTRNGWDKALEPEMRQIYNDLNGAVWQRGRALSRGRQTTPEDFGYKGDAVYREYWQEAIRAALADPNYLKTVAPNVVDRLRESFYGTPFRVNSIEPVVGTNAPA